MTRKDLYERLCRYDARNPAKLDPDEDTPKKGCSCDNCFYGRHKLANLALDLMDQVEAFQHDADLADRD